MKRTTVGLAVGTTLLGLVLATASASAFGISGGGGRVGYLDPESSDGGIALGAHLEMEKAGSQWHLQPNILYWNADRLTGFNGNLDVLYHFGPQTKTTPYLGAGLGFSMVDFENESGDDETDTSPALNTFGGVMFPAGGNSLFVEGRYTFSDVSQAALLFGITVR